MQDKNAREAAVRELRATGRIKENELASLNTENTKRMQSQRASLVANMTGLKTEWHSVNDKQPDPQKQDFKCPSCQQELPEDKVSEKNTIYAKYVADFNGNKVRRLGEITKTGQELKAQVEGLDKSLEGSTLTIQTLEKEMTDLRQQIGTLEAESLKKNQEADQTITGQIIDHLESKDILSKIGLIETEISSLQNDAPDNSAFKTQRQVLLCDLDALKKQHNTKDQIDRGNARIAELNNKERKGPGAATGGNGRHRVRHPGIYPGKDRCAGKPDQSHVQICPGFKLFDQQQVNGQEVECCETTYKGVVFGTLNTAAKILVGIDIINTLSAHYGVSAPIFLDNRESVTSIPDTDAQIINLIVSPGDKQLRVA